MFGSASRDAKLRLPGRLLKACGMSMALLALIFNCAFADSGVDLRPGAELGDLSRREAANLLFQVATLVERQGFIPEDRTRFDRTLEDAVQFVNDQPEDGRIPRADLYRKIRAHLATLDADGHTLLWSRDQSEGWTQRTSPQDVAKGDVVERLTTAHGVVLVFRPPAATFVDSALSTRYAQEAAKQLERADVAPRPCALVISLEDQTGGNAWPAIETLHDMVTPDNRARFVDARGIRRPIAEPWSFGHLEVIARYARTPVGVVLTGKTASAGEMLAVLLRGEPTVRTFGQATYGLTSANRTFPLPDGAQLLLTTERFSFGDGPALVGAMRPDVAVQDSPHQKLAVKAAAEWAASQAAACNV